MLRVFGAKTTFGLGLIALFLSSARLEAQHTPGANFNYNTFNKKNFYFGITLGINSSRYAWTPHSSFLRSDSVSYITSSRGPGFNLGIVTNIKFGEHFDVRFLAPTLSFAERQINYIMPGSRMETRKIESVFIETPVHFRYKSRPYYDTRLFVIAGFKYSIDLASNSRARQAEDLVKIMRNDFALEYGFGFQIFFPYFILSPEIKFSHGIHNIHDRNPNLIYSSSIDRLFSRGIAISFHFEG